MNTRITLSLVLLAACSTSSDNDADATAAADVTAGTPQRGGLVEVHLAPIDPNHTWSATDVAFFASPGLTIDAQTITDSEITALVAIDASAPLGDAAIEVHSGGEVFAAPAAFTVEDVAEALVLHDTLHVQPDAAGAAFAWVAPASPLDLVDVDVTNSAGTIVLDSDGTYPRPLAFAATQTSVIDGVRGVGFYVGTNGAFDVSARRYPLRAVTPTGDGTTFGTATLLGAPGGYVADVRLASADDVHYFAVDVTDASIGQRLRAITLGDPRTDTKLAVFRDDQASMLGPISNDTSALDELVTSTVPLAGRYYIRVTAGAGFDPAHPTFALAVVTR
ncbi:MAG TPA: PPC domain-containing protein [Kofleriaceae bacterium]